MGTEPKMKSRKARPAKNPAPAAGADCTTGLRDGREYPPGPTSSLSSTANGPPAEAFWKAAARFARLR